MTLIGVRSAVPTSLCPGLRTLPARLPRGTNPLPALSKTLPGRSGIGPRLERELVLRLAYDHIHECERGPVVAVELVLGRRHPFVPSKEVAGACSPCLLSKSAEKTDRLPDKAEKSPALTRYAHSGRNPMIEARARGWRG
jgi:hypothetical protein